MRQAKLFLHTLREDPVEAETASHRLLVRAGAIDQLAAGLYTMLPLGLRAQRKVEAIIRDEMDRAGAQEVQMPVLQPVEIWQRSGRDASMGDVLFRLEDKRQRPHVLGPTHEEVVTALVAGQVRSHRDLPGDALSDAHQAPGRSATARRPDASTRVHHERRVLVRCGRSGARRVLRRDVSRLRPPLCAPRVGRRCRSRQTAARLAGKESVEFVLTSGAGEDTIVRCTNPACGYAANTEKAEFGRGAPSDEAALPMEEVATPGIKTIEALADFLGIRTDQTAKAVFYTAITEAKAQLVFVVIRGDVAVNEVKLKNHLKAGELRLATDSEVAAAGLVAGSASPVGLNGFRTVADLSIPSLRNAVAGGNRPDIHLRNVNYERDFTATEVVDIGTARAGDVCARCGATLEVARGMELGHVFKLGTRYSEAFDARYLDAEGREQPIWMGCFGIGVGRTLAAVVEAHHDGKGIVWPVSVAPFDLHLVGLNLDTPEVRAAARRALRGTSATRV